MTEQVAANPSNVVIPGSLRTLRILKIVVVILALIGFYYLNFGREERSWPIQASFNSWLKSVEEAQKNNPEDQNTPLAIQIKGEIRKIGVPMENTIFELSSSGNDYNRTGVLRILQLAREGKLFSRDQAEEFSTGTAPTVSNGKSSNGKPALEFSVHILISDGKRDFLTWLTENEIEERVQVQSLLKLLQIYSEQNK